jgi:hypothetical protein
MTVMTIGTTNYPAALDDASSAQERWGWLNIIASEATLWPEWILSNTTPWDGHPVVGQAIWTTLEGTLYELRWDGPDWIVLNMYYPTEKGWRMKWIHTEPTEDPARRLHQVATQFPSYLIRWQL